MALSVAALSAEALRELDRLYRTTRDVRVRTRAQIVLLAAEKGLPTAQLAEIVRADEQTVRRWIARYQHQGVNGLADAPRPGSPRKITDDYLTQLVAVAQQSPQEFGLPYSRWSVARITAHMARATGIEVHPETVRLHLRACGVTLQAHRPRSRGSG